MMERMREESKKQFGLHKEKQSYERPKKKKNWSHAIMNLHQEKQVHLHI